MNLEIVFCVFIRRWCYCLVRLFLNGYKMCFYFIEILRWDLVNREDKMEVEKDSFIFYNKYVMYF